jgi:putative membrane protein
VAQHPLAIAPLLLLAALVYATGLLAARRRGRSWPSGRAACWYAGLAAATAALAGPDSSFVAHMGGHLLLGMVGPLLLVLGAPGTLALRALPVRQARRLSRFLATRPVRFLVHPVTAAVLDGGGLWVLYATPLFAVVMHSPLIQLHVLVAGVLLAYAVVGPDPMAHRPSPVVRSVALLAFLAAHGILARYLYAHPPAGVPVADAESGAELMYYGGDVADLALVVIFCWQWYDPARFRVGGRRPPQPWRLGSPSSGRRVTHGG